MIMRMDIDDKVLIVSAIIFLGYMVYRNNSTQSKVNFASASKVSAKCPAGTAEAITYYRDKDGVMVKKVGCEPIEIESGKTSGNSLGNLKIG